MHSKNAIQRSCVAKLCEEGRIDQALHAAREIDDPWYRCQSLSYVARAHMHIPKKYEIAREAFLHATWLKDPNRIVTVSAWALADYATFAQNEEVHAEFRRLMEIIAREPHKLRRMDAIYMIVNALLQAKSAVLVNAIDVFIEVCQDCPSWKKDNRILRTIGWLKKIDHPRAEALAKLVYHPRLRRRASRILETATEFDGVAFHF